ncbi:MAG: hypothetical protein WBF51_06685 [Candidatus Dormiibacterota bacterium]
MAEISNAVKIAFYDEARTQAERSTPWARAVVDIQPDGSLWVGVPPPARNKLLDNLIAAAKRHPGMAVGVVLDDNGAPAVLPDPLPLP